MHEVLNYIIGVMMQLGLITVTSCAMVLMIACTIGIIKATVEIFK